MAIERHAEYICRPGVGSGRRPPEAYGCHRDRKRTGCHDDAKIFRQQKVRCLWFFHEPSPPVFPRPSQSPCLVGASPTPTKSEFASLLLVRPLDFTPIKPGV